MKSSDMDWDSFLPTLFAPKLEEEMPQFIVSSNAGDTKLPLSTPLGGTPRGSAYLADPEKLRLLRGEYRIILQLVSSLKYGKLSKALTDHILDRVQHIQNLRECILDYKLQLHALMESHKIPLSSTTAAIAKTSTSFQQKYTLMFQRTLNYLARYFYLVTFSDYYLASVLQLHNSSFHGWLKERKEITNILSTVLNASDIR